MKPERLQTRDSCLHPICPRTGGRASGVRGRARDFSGGPRAGTEVDMLRRHLVRDLLHAATALTSAPDDRRRHGVSGRVTPGSYVADLRLPRGRSLCREETHAQLRVLGRPVAGGDGATGEKRLRTFTPRILILGSILHF